MAAYDSPDYLNQLPGFAPRSSHDYMSPPGSPQAGGDSQPQTTITSGLPGVGTVIDQHGSGAVTEPGQYPDREAFSGLPLDGTGAGQGSAGHHRHPNGPEA